MKFIKKVSMVSLISLFIISGCGLTGSSDKAEDLYASKDVDKNISKAYQYFNNHAKSAYISEKQTISGNKESAKSLGYDFEYDQKDMQTSFEKSNSKEYVVRTDEKNSEEVFSTYTDAGNYYTNLIQSGSGYEYSDKLNGSPKDSINSIAGYDIEVLNGYYVLSVTSNSYEASQEIYQGGKKEQKINKDGSMDFTVHANLKVLNAKEKEQYDYEFSQEYINKLEQEYASFLEKEQLIQDALLRRGTSVDYYLGEYYTKIHVNAEGFITKMVEYIERDTYLNHLNGIEAPFNITKECSVSKINDNTVKKEDVNLLSNEKLDGESNFTKKLSPEETEKIKDGDVINQLPDIQTLVNKDLFYQLNKDTGVIVFIPIEAAYLSWADTWKLGTNEGYEYSPEEKELIKILEAMPSFQEAKANNSLNGRIDYVGNGQWGY